MAGLESILDALGTYWTSSIPLVVLALLAGAMGALVYVFLSNARNAKLRVSLLTGLYALTIFLWAFVAASLVLCVSQANMIAYRKDGVAVAAGGAILAGFALTTVISLVVWRHAAAAVLRRYRPRDPGPAEAGIARYVRSLAGVEGIADLRLGIVDQGSPLAMALGGASPTVLVSTGLLGALDREQTESVLAHEVMHLKHHDAEFKVVSTILSRVLFFDPFSKFFDPAVHREREYLADEMGARATGRPAALASALLALDKWESPRAAWGLHLLGPARGVFSRYPPLRERVHRLLRLSEILSPA